MGSQWSENLPSGVSIRGTSIAITFQYKNVQCRETIKGITASAQSVKYAKNLKAEIESVISKQCFKYSEYFPDSKTKTAKMFGNVITNHTIKNLIDAAVWEDIAPKLTTAYAYKKDAKWCREALGHFRVDELTVKNIRDWIKTMPHLKRKTITNRMTPLRIILSIAVDDDIIQSNPADYVKLGRQSRGLVTREQREKSSTIDPFTLAEIQAILTAADDFHPAAKNYFQLALFAGCRQSELMGLKWVGEDGKPNIDLKNKTLRISEVAVVMGGVSYTQSPKTLSSNRTINLNPLALEALQRQHAATRFSRGYVFARFDAKAYAVGDQLTHNDHYYIPWQQILKAAGVRYRPPKQTRHTFASQELSAGQNPAYISAQLGHGDPQEVFRSYARWIQNDAHMATTGYGVDSLK